MRSDARIYLAGHRGMVGGAILQELGASGAADPIMRTRDELDLRDQAAVRDFMQAERPDAVILAAARVGGIEANDAEPADFIYDNLMIQTNVIHEAFRAGIRQLLFLGSSCIYPKEAPQPMPEDCLMTGPLEPTNEPYAVAKIAGIKLCESYNRQYGVDFRSVMPTNLYGPGDNFAPERSHVVPALMRRFREAVANGASEVAVWGSGTQRREFLHVDDLARAALFVFDLPADALAKEATERRSHINVGSGQEVTIADLARLISDASGFTGKIVFDQGKPEGTPRKLLDTSRLARLGWTPSIPLDAGLRDTYRWFLANHAA